MGLGNHGNLPGPGPGRPKGRLDDLTYELKDIVSKALSKAGGVDYLVRVAKTNPRAFCALLAKFVPRNIQLDVNVNIAEEIEAARKRIRLAE